MENPLDTQSILPKTALLQNTFQKCDIFLKETSAPFYVLYDAVIILETTHSLSSSATDFLVAIAEPITRPNFIHEYKITPYSLYAAVSVGLSTQEILSTLDRFSKNELPYSVVSFIEKCTKGFGKLKGVNKKDGFYLEYRDEESLLRIQKDPILFKLCDPKTQHVMPENVEHVVKRCIEIDLPLIEEFEYAETANQIEISLKPTVQIRSYQETCLNKMFSSGRSRSGVIVLPCGAGKTLVGITSICTLRQPTLILCTSAVSVEQWKSQIILFTNISPDKICCFTSDKKEFVWPCILITTYTMLAYSGKRSQEAQAVMNNVMQSNFALLLLDEVHVVPAVMFRKAVSLVKHYTKVGLTATLVREDDKIEDLNFLIGPKLYEADWQDLTAKLYIAQVECLEVWCEMTAEFYREYLNQTSRRRRLVSIMNPKKFMICDHLIKHHEQKGDKIIVFSDNVYALKAYANRLGKPYIYGPTGQAERMRVLKQFQSSNTTNCIFLSKVGDTSIDLPEATCLIQISSHYGSRRQEAQRLGRILRAKKRNDPGFKVYFYTLVSKDTDEMFYSAKRQQFLVDQGYAFRVVENLNPDLCTVMNTKQEQKEVLAGLITKTENELAFEESNEMEIIAKDLTGGEGLAYMEVNMN